MIFIKFFYFCPILYSMSANLDKLLQQQQGMNNFRDAQKQAFNGYDLEKGIYDAKKQALDTGKTLSKQLLGQERLEALLAAPGIGKTAIGLVKTGIKTATDPEFRAQAGKAIKQGVQDQVDSLTGRAKQSVQGVADDLEGKARGTAARFKQTIDDKTPDTGLIENPLQSGRAPFFGQGGAARRVAEPGDIDYAVQQGARSELEKVNMPTSEVSSIGGFPKEGLAPPRGNIGRTRYPTESENLARIRPAPAAEAPAPASAARAEAPDLPDVEALKPLGQRLREGRRGLVSRETQETSSSDVVKEASRLRGQLPESIARQPLSAEEASKAGYSPPSGEPPLERGIINADSGSYTRPGTNYNVQSTRPGLQAWRPDNRNAATPLEEGRSSNIYPSLDNVESRDTGATDFETAMARDSGERLSGLGRNVDRSGGGDSNYGLPDLPKQEFPKFPDPPSGSSIRSVGQVPSTARGAESRPSGPSRGEDEFGLPKASDEVSSEAKASVDASKAIGSGLKTGSEEIAAEAPLDAVPGLGEVVMAATIVGSLFKAHHEEKEQQHMTAGPAPPPPTPSTPTMAFDSAPTLDTSSYHSV